MNRVAMAIAAHPDDIEFVMGGTLMMLGRAGWDLHYINLATGNGGSLEMDTQTTALVRAGEARRAAGILGAKWYGPMAPDLEIVYGVPILRRLVTVVRRVNPGIVLTHALQDYMEDHMETARLATTAAFAKVVANFRSDPPEAAAHGDVTVYHAMPHSLRDPLRRRVSPGQFVNTTPVHAEKRHALEAHASQRDWLDKTQGMGCYVTTMDILSREVGKLSGKFEHAEGWNRHLHYGFSTGEIDPLAEVLGEDCLVVEEYESGLAGT